MKRLLVTFDVEEVDWGRPRGGARWDATDPSSEGLERVLPALAARGVPATFFVTATFARRRPELLRRLLEDGHEIGSHGLEHLDDYARIPPADALDRLRGSRLALEDVTGRAVRGVRTPRLAPCPAAIVSAAGYAYDASPHPTWLRHGLGGVLAPRRPWQECGIVRVPLSVVPVLRLPAAWYVLRLAGARTTATIARLAGAGTPWIHLYFHPWEGADLGQAGFRHALALATGPGWVRRLCRLLDRLAPSTEARTVGDALDDWLAAERPRKIAGAAQPGGDRPPAVRNQRSGKV